MSRPLLFEISSVDGHTAAYLQVLIEYGDQHDVPGHLSIVVLPAFCRRNPELCQKARAYGIQLLTLTDAEVRTRTERTAAQPSLPFHKLFHASQAAGFALHYDWQLLEQYAQRTDATHCFVPRLHTVLPLLAADYDAPAPISGILFGPCFHEANAASPDARHKQLRERFVLGRVLQRADFRTLFLLNPTAAAAARRQFATDKAMHLVDPSIFEMVNATSAQEIRQRLGIAPHRRVGLLFGDITLRKGVLELLAGLVHLPPEACEQFCLVLAGTMAPDLQQQLEPLIADLLATRPLQIVRHFAYVPQADVGGYFDLADVVLLPYINHSDMSGVLLLAAAAGTPVIASATGLIEELVTMYQLGLLIDPQRPEQIGRALNTVLAEPPDRYFSATGAKRLTEQHDPKHFAACLFKHLMA